MKNRTIERYDYDLYREMQDMAQYLMDMIEHNLSVVFDGTIYNVYVSVGDIEEKTYFCDIEIGGSPEKYNRWYGYYTIERLKKIFDKGHF